MVFCTECGADVGTGRFCPSCGTAAAPAPSGGGGGGSAPTPITNRNLASSSQRSDDWVPAAFQKMGGTEAETQDIAAKMLDETNKVFGSIGVRAQGGTRTGGGGTVGTCAGCGEAVSSSGGRAMQALGKTWHAQCFVCSQCNGEFGSDSFVVRNNKPWCDKCVQWDKKNKAGQGGTGGATRTTPTTTPSTTTTRTTTGGGGMTSDERKKIQDEKQRGRTNCAGCGQVITGNGVQSTHGVYHDHCFTCNACHEAIDSGTPFVESDGHPFHKTCYQKKTGTPCGKCGEAISGQFVAAEGVKYHKTCFVCTGCHKPLAGGFVLKTGKPYCTSGCTAMSTTTTEVASHATPGIRVDPRSGKVTKVAGGVSSIGLQQPTGAGRGVTTTTTTTTTSGGGGGGGGGGGAKKRFCPECGAANPGPFCGECGAKASA